MTSVVPGEKISSGLWVLVIMTSSLQLSVACGLVHVTTASHSFVLIIISVVGQRVNTGGTLSSTMTLKLQVEEFAKASVAV